MSKRNHGRRRIFIERLEGRWIPAAGFPEFIDPHPAASNQFGTFVEPLSNGNVVIAAPMDDAGGTDAGAVYLFDGATGALISTITGSRANDNIGGGGILPLANGNFLILSPNWDNGAVTDAGAVTFGSGVTGVSGAMSSANSLVGSTANDKVGDSLSGISVIALATGGYVVLMRTWDNGAVVDAGAATFGNGTTGVSGTISAANSLVGSVANDFNGAYVTALTNGAYVVGAPNWDSGALVNVGAAAWGSSASGVVGTISSANALVGSAANNLVAGGGVFALSSGNYVVNSYNWDNGATANVGAVTFGNGTTGVKGTVGSGNSLIGSKANDQVGYTNGFGGQITVLTNGAYVVQSLNWDNGAAVDVGAATWGSGTTGVSGVLSSANSLIGSGGGAHTGRSVYELPNGHYVVQSDNGMTWGNGTTGVSGTVSASNSMMGFLAGNGGIVNLTNGNYVILSPSWVNGSISNAGAATWASGTGGTVGTISASNSIVGGATNASVGSRATALTNGNYVVNNPYWTNGTTNNLGVVTWASGTGPTGLTVSAANSFVGVTAFDQLGTVITPLTNGNYVIGSANWNNGAQANAGAATWASGTASLTGNVSSANSLIGSKTDDFVGNIVIALTNGNYVVGNSGWDNGSTVDAGSVTWGSGTVGVKGTVSAANSLVGTRTGDAVGVGPFGLNAIVALTNGNYIVGSPSWDNAAVTDVGAVTWGNGAAATVGAVSSSNSLIGSTSGDQIGSDFIIPLSNGTVLVESRSWHNGGSPTAGGAVTWLNGSSATVGVVSATNSVVGPAAGAYPEYPKLDDVNKTFMVQFTYEDNGKVRLGSQIDGFARSTAVLSAGTLTVTGHSGNNNFTVFLSGSNLRVQDSNYITAGSGVTQIDAFTVQVPFANITGSITLNSVDGDDTATVNLATGDAIPAGGITFNGGNPTTGAGDSLVITGGSQGTVTYNYTAGTPGAGSVVMSNFGTVNYAGLEPVSNFGAADNVVINLPSVANTVTVGDDGVAGNGLSRVSGSTFEQTTFANPVNSVTINRGNASDVITVNALPDFTTGLTIGSGAAPFATINLSGAVAPAAGKSLAFFGTNVNATATGAVTTTGGGNITLNADNLDVNAVATLNAGGVLTVLAITAARAFDLGTNTAGTVALTDAELDRLTAGTLQIGNASAGAITVSAALTHGNDLSLNSGAGITVNQALTMAVDKDWSATAVGTISLAATSSDVTTSGTGTVTLTSTRNISLASGSSVTTVNGGITMTANLAGTAAGNFPGIGLTTATISTTGTGNVSLTGIGGVSTSNSNYGISLLSGAQTLSTAAGLAANQGKLTFVGTGGGGAGSRFNQGILINGAGSKVSSSSGAVALTGQGGAASGASNEGVLIGAAGVVESTGTATITINGTGGGTSTSSDNHGVVVTDVNSKVTSVAGAVSVTGQGATAATGTANKGVLINTGGQVVSTGAATLTLQGTGGGGAGSTLNDGILIFGASARVTSANGAILLNGTGGAGGVSGTSLGVSLGSSANVNSSGTAAITLVGDSIGIDVGTTITAGTNAVTLSTKTTGTLVDLGGADAAGKLGLTDAELDRITAGSLQLGESFGGAITVSADITRSAATAMQLRSAGDIVLSGGQINTNGGTLLLDPGTSPAAVKATKSGTDVSASVLSFAGNAAFVLNGVTADTNYTQLNVVGQVNLTGAAAAFSGTYTPTGPQTFILVNNDGADAVVGNFIGLAEGAVISGFFGSLFQGVISYHGGDGNDVTLAIEPTTQWVNSFAATATGARFTLSQPAAIGPLNLFDYRDAGGLSVLGAADVTLVGATVGAVTGSLIIEPGDTGFRFVSTNGVLPPDSYTFTVRSAANAFQTVGGALLDGNADSVAGGDFSSVFNVTTPAANSVTVSLPNFSRGPDQPVNTPADTATGLPVRISNGNQVKSLTFVLRFDPALINVTGVALPAGAPGGSSAVLTPQGAGQVQVALTFGSTLSAGSQIAAYLTAAVPTTAAGRYGERAALDISAIDLRDGGGVTIPALDQDAIHANAYFGDVGRNGRYDSFDIQQASRVAVRLDSGFQQHPLLDPTILCDFNGNGRIDSFDVQRLSRLALRLPVTEAPALPSPLPTTTDTDRIVADDPPAMAPEKSADESEPAPAPAALRSDVDGNGAVDAQDVLWAIYYFNRTANGDLPAEATKLDVNHDALFDAADVLLTITDVNAQPRAPEGESTDSDSLIGLLAEDVLTAKKKR